MSDLLGKPDIGNEETALRYHRAASQAFTTFLIALCAAFLFYDLVIGDDAVVTVLAVCVIAALIIRQVYLSIAGVAGYVPHERRKRLIGHPWLMPIVAAVIVSVEAYVRQMRGGHTAAKSLFFAAISGAACGAYLWWSKWRNRVSRAS